MNTWACRKSVDLCRRHARTKEYSIDLIENMSLQNPHTLMQVSPLCNFTCDWLKLNMWLTPWQHRLSTCWSLVAISHMISRNWPDRLFSTSQITYWSVIAYQQVNKLFSVLVSTCVCAVDTKTVVEVHPPTLLSQTWSKHCYLMNIPSISLITTGVTCTKKLAQGYIVKVHFIYSNA